MPKQFFILLIILVCISAKKHRNEQDNQDEQCLIDNCAQQLNACDEACENLIQKCGKDNGENPNDVVQCLKQDPTAWKLLECALDKCISKDKKLRQSTRKHLFRLARAF